ncbi:MAG TPA: hypothetical protein VF465_00840, partial [Flavobacterium sp.]|uniref:hypothetical protein n=1 Tax=Flavobacterium sp. TaxID=239 RepID=UPI002ED67121
MADMINKNATKEELLDNAIQSKKPLFLDPDFKLKNSVVYTDNQKNCMYLELLHNSLCTNITLSKQTGIHLNHIRNLNQSQGNNLLSIKHLVCNDNGCDPFYFYTLNKDLHDKYKDVEAI